MLNEISIDLNTEDKNKVEKYLAFLEDKLKLKKTSS